MSEIDDYKSKMISNRISNEPPLEVGEVQANFLDEAFGENTPVENYLEEAKTVMAREENRL